MDTKKSTTRRLLERLGAPLAGLLLFLLLALLLAMSTSANPFLYSAG